MIKKDDLRERAGGSYWHEADARVIIEAWQQSGETASAFGRRLGVDPRRLSRWAARLSASERAPVHFHPVRVASEGTDRRAASIEIELGGGRRVRVAAGFEAEDLRRVLAVLDEAAPC